jgi:hypothetical protein
VPLSLALRHWRRRRPDFSVIDANLNACLAKTAISGIRNTAGDTLSGACSGDNDRGGKQRSDHNFAFHLGILFWI